MRQERTQNKKRGNLKAASRLIVLVKPLWLFMIFAVALGTAGFLCAAFIPALGALSALKAANVDCGGVPLFGSLPAKVLFTIVAIIAVLRGVLHYLEQYCNHYIAFTILAVMRDKVFFALRRLCPAKLECKEKGDLISLISSDIELLEVFYAHTLSPLAIAVLFCAAICVFMACVHVSFAFISLCAFVVCGVFVPLVGAKKSRQAAESLREKSGELSSFVLESLRGIGTILQFGMSESRIFKMKEKTQELLREEKKIKLNGGRFSALTNSAILLFDCVMICASAQLLIGGKVSFAESLVSFVLLTSSFGPVVALSNLGTTLQNTFAAANRVLDILDEQPETEEIKEMSEVEFSGVNVEDLSFSYGSEEVLRNVNAGFPLGSIVVVSGKSGSGKSTLLKLLMRFWKAQHGSINFGSTEINRLNTSNLRRMESYVTQETCLFKGTIEDNLKIAKSDASEEEIRSACKKARIHDFIMSLPEGYRTQVGELGDTLSSGERQRISLARAFLRDCPLLLLDEPTSNLDSLNEAVIIKSVKEEAVGKTVILVSHKELTRSIADKSFSVENGRLS